MNLTQIVIIDCFLLFVFRSNIDQSDFKVCTQCQLAQDNQISSDDHILPNACLLCKRAIEDEKKIQISNKNSKQNINQLSPFNQIFTCAQEREEYDNETCATNIKYCAKYKREEKQREKKTSLQKTSDINENQQHQPRQKEQQKPQQQKTHQQQSKPAKRYKTKDHVDKKTPTKPKHSINKKRPVRKSKSPSATKDKGKPTNTNTNNRDNKTAQPPPPKQTRKRNEELFNESKQKQNKKIENSLDEKEESEAEIIDETNNQEDKESLSSYESSEALKKKCQGIQKKILDHLDRMKVQKYVRRVQKII